MMPALVYLFGRDISQRVESVEIACELGNLCCETSIELRDRAGLDLLKMRLPTEKLAIEVYCWSAEAGEEPGYRFAGKFYLESAQYDDDPSSTKATLWGRTHGAMLTAPWAGRVTKQFSDTTINPSDFVTESEFQDVYCLSFQGIPSGAYIADGLTPAEMLAELTELAGEILIPGTGYWRANNSFVGGEPVYKERNQGPIWASAADYYPLPKDVITSMSITRYNPDYANRVFITGEVAPQTRSIDVSVLGDSLIPADGKATAHVIAIVRDEVGEIIDNIDVHWASSDGTLQHRTSQPSANNPPYTEVIRADDYRHATLSYHANQILGVYSDASRVPSKGSAVDTSANSLMNTLGGSLSGNRISFSSDLDYYDQQLWVRYVPIGAPNRYTASTRTGMVSISASVDGGNGSVMIRQGVPESSNQIVVLPTVESVCFGDTAKKINIVGRISGAAATGQVKISMSGCGTISATTATFGSGSVTEPLRVDGIDRAGEKYVVTTTVPNNTPVFVDAEGQPVTALADPAQDKVFWVDADLRSTIYATYNANGVASVNWTPPAYEGDPGGSTTNSYLQVITEEVPVYYDTVPQWWPVGGGSWWTTGSFVDISHPIYVTGMFDTPYDIILCLFPYAYSPGIFGHKPESSNYYHSYDIAKQRVRIAPFKTASNRYDNLFPIGEMCKIRYTTKITTTEPIPKRRQTSCSAEITAKIEDGSQAGVIGTGRISGTDCYYDAEPGGS
ncbi:MAG: hypothetical protein RBR42_05095 [Desulfomicrobium sp.]|nr:hypothetical protein [Desulfomicrobium sp.]